MARKRYNKGNRLDMRQGGRVALARGRRPMDEEQVGLQQAPIEPIKQRPEGMSISQQEQLGLNDKPVGSRTPAPITTDPTPVQQVRPQTTSISQPQSKAEQPSVQTAREDTMTDAQKEAAERALQAAQGRGKGAGSGGRGTGGGGGGNNTTETTSTTTGARPGTEKPTYSNLTEAQQEEARQRVKDAAEGKVPESAIIPDAVKADESIASDTVTMEDVGDAKAETIEMPSEEQVTTGVSTTAKKQEVGDAAKMEASKITEAPVIDAQTGQVSPEAIAEMQNATLTMAATGVTVDEGKASDALAETIVGTLSPEAKAEAAKVAGTDLPRVLRAKKQLRRAGLTEDQINLIGNDPDLLEDELINYTEAERGMIAGLPEEALVTTQ